MNDVQGAYSCPDRCDCQGPARSVGSLAPRKGGSRRRHCNPHGNEYKQSNESVSLEVAELHKQGAWEWCNCWADFLHCAFCRVWQHFKAYNWIRSLYEADDWATHACTSFLCPGS